MSDGSHRLNALDQDEHGHRATEAADIARAFHAAYERLAPAYGYRTREASAVPWEAVPENNRQLMIATVAALLADGVIAAAKECS